MVLSADFENIRRFVLAHFMYGSYKAMRNRCYNPNSASYKNYGLRGIKVCDRWLEPNGKGFRNFLEDMGERPQGHSLDRIDNNGDYCKENCRWADNRTQNRNRRNNVSIDFEGKSYILKDVCEKFKINEELLKYRINAGLSLEEALKTPPNPRRKSLKLQFGIVIRDIVFSNEYSYKRSNCSRQWNKYLKKYLEGEYTNQDYLTYSKFLLAKGLATQEMFVYL